ncbi:hypothetical protein QQ056_19745 [Oscillatoria laete-virens NRMC-F 0139]|nr:hypothetical protein [Oscillatoria laete-virens]MDL5055765.1 hypothetical protein [Oscillatoria laete-virens NRMC-F 0139]
MIEIIAGFILGTLSSLLISHYYSQQASRELRHLINSIKEQNNNLKDNIKCLEKWHEVTYDDIQTIWKSSLRGTPEDPEYPYK